MSLQSTDQIADLITRIRNAMMVGKTEIAVPTSKLKVAVVEGYGNGQDLSYLYLIVSLFVGYYHRALLNGIDTER